MDIKDIYQNVIDGESQKVEAGVEAALAAGITAEIILNQALIAAMAEVGQRFESGDFFVPEMLVAAQAMQAGMRRLKPHLIETGINSVAKIAIGTVKGDLHDIGKSLVAMMLEGAGFEVKDLGSDVAPEKFVTAAQVDQVDIVALSALLTTTMVNMKATIDALETVGLRNKVKVMIGGAPVTQAYAEQIGADGYGPDASSAVRLAKSLIGT